MAAAAATAAAIAPALKEPLASLAASSSDPAVLGSLSCANNVAENVGAITKASR
jgi:hypothetical protein